MEDVQLMELAGRSAGSFRLCSLEVCISLDARKTSTEIAPWHHVKEEGEKGKDRCSPQKPGCNDGPDRSLLDEIKQHCADHVRYLPTLRQKYLGRLSVGQQKKVEYETIKRIMESRHASCRATGPPKAFGPYSFSERTW
jgi:hypothetical protein